MGQSQANSGIARQELTDLVIAYEPALRRFFSRKLSDHADVEDLVQDVFTRLARLDDLAIIENPQAFIFQIAQNLLRDRGRRGLVRQAGAHEPYNEVTHSHEDFSAERVLIGRQRVQQVKQAILAMPRRTAEVFTLNRFDGLTYKEIAQTLRISVSSVEKHMMTALAALNRKVDQE